MGTRIVGRELALRTSNGGGWALFRTWIVIGENFVNDPQVAAVIDFLRGRLLVKPKQVRDFDLDPPPRELSDGHRLRAFAVINAEAASQLSQRASSIHQHRDDTLFRLGRQDRLHWLARLLDLQEMLTEQLDSGQSAVQQPSLELSDHEHKLITVYRWLTRVHELRRRRATPDSIIALIDRGLPLAEEMLSVTEPWQLYQLHEIQAELHIECDQPAAAATALRTAALYAEEPLTTLICEQADRYDRHLTS